MIDHACCIFHWQCNKQNQWWQKKKKNNALQQKGKGGLQRRQKAVKYWFRKFDFKIAVVVSCKCFIFAYLTEDLELLFNQKKNWYKFSKNNPTNDNTHIFRAGQGYSTLLQHSSQRPFSHSSSPWQKPCCSSSSNSSRQSRTSYLSIQAGMERSSTPWFGLWRRPTLFFKAKKVLLFPFYLQQDSSSPGSFHSFFIYIWHCELAFLLPSLINELLCKRNWRNVIKKSRVHKRNKGKHTWMGGGRIGETNNGK